MSIISDLIDLALVAIPLPGEHGEAAAARAGGHPDRQDKPGWVIPVCIALFLFTLTIALLALLGPAHAQVLALLGRLEDPTVNLVGLAVLGLLGVLGGMRGAAGFENRPMRLVAMLGGVTLMFGMGVAVLYQVLG